MNKVHVYQGKGLQNSLIEFSGEAKALADSAELELFLLVNGHHVTDLGTQDGGLESRYLSVQPPLSREGLSAIGNLASYGTIQPPGFECFAETFCRPDESRYNLLAIGDVLHSRRSVTPFPEEDL